MAPVVPEVAELSRLFARCVVTDTCGREVRKKLNSERLVCHNAVVGVPFCNASQFLSGRCLKVVALEAMNPNAVFELDCAD